MIDQQIDRFEKEIRERLPMYDSPEAAASGLREFMMGMGFPFTELHRDALAEATRRVADSIGKIEILRRASIAKVHEPWYSGPRPTDKHWPALRGYLRNDKGWDEATVDSIDESSSEVVSLLANPALNQFRYRGLVVGYVQSGKTANMTAVIAKAVDAGYNLIIVLGGVTNKLRAQTQGRMERDVVKRHVEQWQLYTTQDDWGDFVVPRNQGFTMPVPGRAQLMVMKKVASRLQAFRRTVERTPPVILRRLKVLLIDDECDQASVNAANKDQDMTRINEEIRKVIRDLPAVTYVGYTATPFANVFIDPFPFNKDTLDDLYPEDFITALPRPDGYFGAREVFGCDPMDASNESEVEAGRDMVRVIPNEEVGSLRPTGPAAKDVFNPMVTASLEDAMLWFLATCSMRISRGHSDKHMTMLVHTSQFVVQHERMSGAIREWLASHADELRSRRGPTWKRLKALVIEEITSVPGPDGGASPADLVHHLPIVLDRLEVVVENSVSDDRLQYSKLPKIYIVVGGSVLARGLTLEGLSVSFFLRTSRQYDTLLQMGRWFGFRPGYEDLPRLWTTSALLESFRALGRVEEEIREEIEVYREHGWTPLEFAVKVRGIPGMAITAATKMRHAHKTSISFEGRHVQTIRFDHRSFDVVSENWRAGSELVDRASNHGRWETVRPAAKLVRGVPLADVRRFLVDYHISSAHMDLRREHLLGYLDRGHEGLAEWNIGVVGSANGRASDLALGKLGQVPLSTRSKLKRTDEEVADIKALMSRRDILLDVADAEESRSSGTWAEFKALRPKVPLLLIYPIDQHSSPRRPSQNRESLDAEGDLLGIGIVFPGDLDRGGDYFQVELEAPTPEELEAEDLIVDEDG